MKFKKIFYFTKNRSKSINKKIEKDLEFLIKTIVKYEQKIKLKSIILVGGFGRGEGSIIFEKHNPKPLNDYDVFVIVNKSRNPFFYLKLYKCLSESSKFISEKLGVHVDLMPLFYEDLPKLKPSILFYETKYGSKILWGEDITSLIPKMLPQEIPKTECIDLLFNRMLSLIYGYPILKTKEFTILQSLKSFQACSEALLLYCGQYDYSYETRMNTFELVFKKNYPSLMEKLPKLPFYVKKSINFKLKPEFSNFKNPEKLWRSAVETHLLIFKYLLTNYYGLKLNETMENIIQKYLISKKRFALDNLFYWIISIYLLLRKKILPSFLVSLSYRPINFIYASEPFILTALYNSNPKGLKYAKKYLEKVITIKKNTDYELRSKCILAWGRGEYDP